MKSLTLTEKSYIRLGIGHTIEDWSEWENQGLRDFRDNQSTGYVPEQHHPTFSILQEGKKRKDIMVKEIREDYFSCLGTGHWVGLYCFVQDWKEDLWILPVLLPWHPKIHNLNKFIMHEEEPNESSSSGH